jgi:hypothetical protein
MDMGMIVSGRIVLELGDGETKELGSGDTDEPCHWVAVMVGAEHDCV